MKGKIIYVSPLILPNQISPFYSAKVFDILKRKGESCHTHTMLIELLQTCK